MPTPKCIYQATWREGGGPPKERFVPAKKPPDYSSQLTSYMDKLTLMQLAMLTDAARTPLDVQGIGGVGQNVGPSGSIASMGEAAIAGTYGNMPVADYAGEGEGGLYPGGGSAGGPYIPLGEGQSAGTYGAYSGRGLQPHLLDSINQAIASGKALPPGYTAKIKSGREPRARGGEHPKGNAADVQIYDEKGREVPWYQNAGSFRIYEQFAQQVKREQMKRYPKETFTWGGYFVNGYPGRGRMPYGTADLMHMQWGGPMAGGTWERGATGPIREWLNREGGKSVGMGADTKTTDELAKKEADAVEAGKQGKTPEEEEKKYGYKVVPTGGTAPGYNVTRGTVEAYIIEAAKKRGIDPSTALEVYRHEGVNNWQSQVPRSGAGSYNGKEASWGPFQLYERGLGANAPFNIRDPNTWRQNVDWALDAVVSDPRGWGQWMGAAAAGIKGKAGVGGNASPFGVTPGAPGAPAGGYPGGGTGPSGGYGGGPGGGYGPGGIGGTGRGLLQRASYTTAPTPSQGMRSFGQHGATGTWGLPPKVERYISTIDPKFREMARRQYLRISDPSYIVTTLGSTLANYLGPMLPYGEVTWLYGDEPKGYAQWKASEAARKKK